MPLSSAIWACTVSPFVGSFLGVVVMRHNDMGSVVVGRSACAACGATLGARDLVPVISWAVSRGQCRHCGGAIGLFYPAIELAAFGVAIWSALVFSGVALWISCLLGWALIALAATDFKYFLLPNFLTLPLIPAGFLANWALGFASIADCALGAVCGFLFVIALRFLYQKLRGHEGIGLGDAKLLAAAGAWVSWSGLPSVVAIAALSGLAFALLARRLNDRISLSDRVPFGAFLAVGLWIVWLYGPLAKG